MELNRAIVAEDMRQIADAPLPWSEFAGARILVTGATGFLAAYLVETFLYLNDHRLSRPAHVLALARNRGKIERRFKGMAGRPDLQFLIQDVCHPLDTPGPIDFMVHAASPASPRSYMADPAGTLLANIIGTHHLLELAGRSRTRRFLFVSSGEAYGRFTPVPAEPVKESDYGSIDPLDRRACYAEGKRAGEALCAAWWHQHRLPAVIARLGHTYGPGMDLADGRVFSDFVANVVRGEPIEMRSSGDAVRPFCYVTDAVLGLLTLLLSGESGQAYNLVNDEASISVRELASTLAALFPERNIRVVRGAVPPSAGIAAPNQRISIDTGKIRALGWAPRISVREGFGRAIRSYSA
ncbi:MAG: NAD-dependent epimerase/dehydratase family protein [Opitutaceae bacterium]